jgi:hypothetical protein
MANVTSSYGGYRISYGEYRIAHGEYRTPYGENHIALRRKLFWYGEKYSGVDHVWGNHLRGTLGGGAHHDNSCLLAAAFAWLRFNSSAFSRRFFNANRAKRAAESGRRCSSVVKY